MNFVNLMEINLDSIRQELIRLEDSILFALIERSLFALNSRIYSTAKDSPLSAIPVSPADNAIQDGSFLDQMLFEIESVHGMWKFPLF
jgi:chorismate mutase